MRLICSLLFVSIVLISCTKDKKAEETFTIVSGTIKNATSDKFAFKAFDIDSEDNTVFITPIGEDGTFIDTLDVAIKAGHYYCNEGKNNMILYLKQGDHLKINYDASQFPKSANFSGKGSEISQYLHKKRIFFDSIYKEKHYLLEEKKFIEQLHKTTQSKYEILNRHSAIPLEYKTMESKNIHYEYLRSLMSYVHSHAPSHRWFYKDNAVISDSLSNTFKKELNKLDLNNEKDFIFSQSYRSVKYDLMMDEAVAKVANDTLLDRDIVLLKAIKQIPSKIIRHNLTYRIRPNEDWVFSEDNMWLYKHLTEAYSEKYKDLKLPHPIPETVVPGKPSPKFVDFENLKEGGTTSLDDFKGRHVYIDLWATWCAPCRAEIPFLRKIETDFHDKNIAFVSISMDQEREYKKLKNLVQDKNLTGVQLYANGQGYESDFAKAYGVGFIPRFILIDPDGNIVDANAPRPSEKRLRVLFNKLLH